MAIDPTADKLAALMEGPRATSATWPAAVTDPIPMAMSQRHADAVMGIYVVDVGYPDGTTDFSTLSPPEMEFAQWIQAWWMREGAFNMIQSTKPQSLAFAMNDSPVGLAAWLMILFASGAPDKVEERFTLDELITNAMIYWVSGSDRLGDAQVPRDRAGGLREPGRAEARPAALCPPAMARMPLDAPVPREWAERQVNLVYWSEPARGGHHSSWEVPDIFSADLRAFLKQLRS